MSNFDKVLHTLDDQERDINDAHKASEATKKRMETLNKRFTNEEKALKEATRLTRTAEEVLKVEVALSAANLSTLKTNLGADLFREFLKNIAHKNEDNRAIALKQMQEILGLESISLDLSMSDKHSEQLIRTEILDHIAQQLLGGSNLTIAANYIYGSDEVLDIKLDDMSNQIIAMLEGFKESDSQESVSPQKASYNALYKASDQRYFDDASLDSGNKLRGGVMGAFAEKMANESLMADNGSSVINYKELANKFLSVGIDLNAKELVILTGNGMLPFEAPTRSQFKFQYLTYLPELGGYAGVMANGCGDEGKEGNFVFIEDDQSKTSKKLTRDGFITEEDRQFNEEKKRLEEMEHGEWIRKAENEGNDTENMTEDDWKEFKEAAKIKLDDDHFMSKENEALKEADAKAKAEADKKAEEEAKKQQEKTIEDKEWSEISATGTLHPEGSLTRGVVNFGPDMAGKTVHIVMRDPSKDPLSPEMPGVSKEFTVRPDGTVEVTNDFYMPQSETGMVNIVVSNKPIDSTNPAGSKEVPLVPPVPVDVKSEETPEEEINNDVPTTDNNTEEKLDFGDNDALAGTEAAGSDREKKLRRMVKLSPFEKKSLKAATDGGISEEDLENYIVEQARTTEREKGLGTVWKNISFTMKDVRERVVTAAKIRFLDYRLNGDLQRVKGGPVDMGKLFQSREDALGFLASSPTLETGAKITLTKEVIVNGVTFPAVTFESSYNQNDLKIKDGVAKDSEGNEYKAVVANGIVSFMKQGVTKEKEEVTE